MLLGLRGVGKTVLLNRISELAEEKGYLVVQLEAPEGQRLAEYLAPALKSVIPRLSKVDRAKDYAARAMGALRGFASAWLASSMKRLAESAYAISMRHPLRPGGGSPARTSPR